MPVICDSGSPDVTARTRREPAVTDAVRTQHGPSTPALQPRNQPEPMRRQISVRDVNHADESVVHRLRGLHSLLLGAKGQAEHEPL